MGERKENCRRQIGMDCRGCEVAVDVANNVISNPKKSVVESIVEVTSERCPEDTKFMLNGDLRELLDGSSKVIQLRPIDGKVSTNQEGAGAAAAGL